MAGRKRRNGKRRSTNAHNSDLPATPSRLRESTNQAQPSIEPLPPVNPTGNLSGSVPYRTLYSAAQYASPIISAAEALSSHPGLQRQHFTAVNSTVTSHPVSAPQDHFHSPFPIHPSISPLSMGPSSGSQQAGPVAGSPPWQTTRLATVMDCYRELGLSRNQGNNLTFDVHRFSNFADC